MNSSPHFMRNKNFLLNFSLIFFSLKLFEICPKITQKLKNSTRKLSENLKFLTESYPEIRKSYLKEASKSESYKIAVRPTRMFCRLFP